MRYVEMVASLKFWSGAFKPISLGTGLRARIKVTQKCVLYAFRKWTNIHKPYRFRSLSTYEKMKKSMPCATKLPDLSKRMPLSLQHLIPSYPVQQWSHLLAREDMLPSSKIWSKLRFRVLLPQAASTSNHAKITLLTFLALIGVSSTDNPR